MTLARVVNQAMFHLATQAVLRLFNKSTCARSTHLRMTAANAPTTFSCSTTSATPSCSLSTTVSSMEAITNVLLVMAGTSFRMEGAFKHLLRIARKPYHFGAARLATKVGFCQATLTSSRCRMALKFDWIKLYQLMASRFLSI